MDIFFTTKLVPLIIVRNWPGGTLPGIFKKTPCKTTHAVLLINSINFYIFIGCIIYTVEHGSSLVLHVQVQV